MLKVGSIAFTSFLLFSVSLPAQQNPQTNPAPPQKTPIIIPVEASHKTNPVKPTQESLEKGKKWWGIDCAMCHGQNGDGKGDTARDMKLQIPDFTDPSTLKGRTDGDLFYIIQNGHQDMPPEGTRLKPEEYWDLVNYVRSLAKAKPEQVKEQKTQ